ncbi:hypothetical protein OEZ85_008123 [Tetradesmus obliquus]|uniref:Anaphase-promoting complex subunit 4 WD40 domain-containing protein n=1 Tax=Tetradesmus obliquus TaxID=3088 RepID=A0ABY8THZ1_TETOB|nr:hypothetical protein OEZ85_008123 [Tetradesmus obliquus]
MQTANQLRYSSASNRFAACPGRRRPVLARIAEAEAPAATAPAPPAAAPHRAVLLKKFKAHDASVTALSVLDDAAGLKRVITTSLDKTLCTWSLEGGDQDAGTKLLCTKVEVAGGPVFSLHPGFKPKIKDPNTKQSRPVVYCGLAAKEIAAWQPDALQFSEQVRMNGHTGWVRSMSSSGKYLFSCGCNYLRQWDQAYAVPKEVSSTKLFTGDILAIAASDKRVFTAGADGALRCWTIGKGSGELAEAAVREKAHDGRITALVVCGSLLYSAGYDGTIKAWDAASLKLVMELLYSGGDDGLVRCWDARLMTPVGEPLAVHGAAVKALAVGDSEVLVSGDASGEVAVWCV